ncbi:3-keto-5-aminohexanoate cleavage protein [uncultured Deinococcus sp.]|uniref:3-keto-5-aminohexanoate cleavage protein n=1 Tax=uncultured Deinococcus sp. TaxID=158789 RepID=UPI00258CA3A8|nr:3-keto-5-aminohexanoate cleavage protein [uncultured Deinococcus sp.]
MLQACLNGPRTPADHPAVPLRPAELAAQALAAVRAGAQALHLHPRSAGGRESLSADDVASALRAVRAACPGVPAGISSGFWILPDVEGQLAAARAWLALPPQARPDYVSVNVHEPHARALADLLLGGGIGVEAGVWTPEAAAQLRGWPGTDRLTRILAELPDGPEEAALSQADALLAALRGVAPGVPRLLHGLDRSAWPLVRRAAERGLATRAGLEDMLTLPDGRPAQDNAAIVEAARAVLASRR